MQKKQSGESAKNPDKVPNFSYLIEHVVLFEY